MARPRKPVDLTEVIGRRWAGQSFPVIARSMHLGYGTVVRAYRTATVALQAVQNPKAEQIRALRLENRQREQELDHREIQRGAAPATVLPFPIPAPPIVPPSPSQSRGAVGRDAKPIEKADPVTSSWKTGGSWNGRFWRPGSLLRHARKRAHLDTERRLRHCGALFRSR